MQAQTNLLESDEPSPVRIANPAGASPHLILCDHAGRLVPRRLGDLGVSAADMQRHIAWDIGVEAVGALLGAALDAVVIAQVYSRLVIDCNRAPGHPASVPAVSDSTPIPGNTGLHESAIAARIRDIVMPYHAAIAAELNRREAVRQACAVIAVHSFTPVFGGAARHWQAGVLHDRDPQFALAVGGLLREAGLLVGDNEPYQMNDCSDYTVPVHAERRKLPYVELEIRQDLIADAAGQRQWAALLAEVLPAAWRRVGGQQAQNAKASSATATPAPATD